jgi:hypothetical protein
MLAEPLEGAPRWLMAGFERDAQNIQRIEQAATMSAVRLNAAISSARSSSLKLTTLPPQGADMPTANRHMLINDRENLAVSGLD